MPEVAVIYGCIQSPPGPTDDWGRLYSLNRTLIHELPEEGEWPVIRRSFFQTPIVDWSKPGLTRTQVISFGWSVNFGEESWPNLLLKFEEVLKTLYWLEAVLHLKTEMSGDLTYSWEASGNSIERLWADPPEPTVDWTRSVSG